MKRWLLSLPLLLGCPQDQAAVPKPPAPRSGDVASTTTDAPSREDVAPADSGGRVTFAAPGPVAQLPLDDVLAEDVGTLFVQLSVGHARAELDFVLRKTTRFHAPTVGPGEDEFRVRVRGDRGVVEYPFGVSGLIPVEAGEQLEGDELVYGDHVLARSMPVLVGLPDWPLPLELEVLDASGESIETFTVAASDVE